MSSSHFSRDLVLPVGGARLPGQTAPLGVVPAVFANAHLNTPSTPPSGLPCTTEIVSKPKHPGALSLRSGQIQLTLSESSTLWIES